MPDAPWDKDQRPSIQQRVPSVEYSRSTPYATFDNMDRQKQACLCGLLSVCLEPKDLFEIYNGHCNVYILLTLSVV